MTHKQSKFIEEFARNVRDIIQESDIKPELREALSEDAWTVIDIGKGEKDASV